MSLLSLLYSFYHWAKSYLVHGLMDWATDERDRLGILAWKIHFGFRPPFWGRQIIQIWPVYPSGWTTVRQVRRAKQFFRFLKPCLSIVITYNLLAHKICTQALPWTLVTGNQKFFYFFYFLAQAIRMHQYSIFIIPDTFKNKYPFLFFIFLLKTRIQKEKCWI